MDNFFHSGTPGLLGIILWKWGGVFNKDPAKIETLNDLDGEVYNLFKVIRDRPEEFAKSLEMTPYSREEYENAYKKVSAETELERARKFMVRCWLGMGSSNVYKNGFRSSQQGNSPKNPGKVLISGYDNDLYNEILNGWSKAQKQTQAEHGLKRIETVWFNYAKEYQLKF